MMSRQEKGYGGRLNLFLFAISLLEPSLYFGI